MSRLPEPNLTDSYDKASLASVLRAIIGQVNSVSEGGISGRYQAQVSQPGSTAVALTTGDIVWDSNPTLSSSVVAGLAADYVRLGWVVRSPGTAASATMSEIRALIGSGSISSLLTSPLQVMVGAATVSLSVQASDGTIAYTAGQTFTGVCTAPTAATATNTTQLATTAFVQQELVTHLLAEQATTSGTTIDFSVPPGVREVQVMFASVSSVGTGAFQIQLGDAGGLEASGYSGGVGTRGAELANSSAFNVVQAAVAANNFSGRIVLSLENASTFTWAQSGVISNATSGFPHFSGGAKALSEELSLIRFKNSAGNTLDNGGVSAAYRF